MRIGQIASVWNIKWTKNLKIANFWSLILVFQIEKILEIF